MKAGLTSVTFRAKSAEEIVKIALHSGLGCIEWGADVHARPDATDDLDKIATFESIYGIENISYGSYYRAGAENKYSARTVIAAAKRLGARRIRVWAGELPSARTDARTFENMCVDLREFVSVAAAENLTVATEFHHGTFTDTAESTLKLLNAVPGLRTYWQENPQITFAENLSELERLLPFVETIHTFCFDADLYRYPLETASERWHEYIRAVKNAGKNDLPFLLEFVKSDSKEQAEHDALSLQKWLKEESA